ncbi:hypothetical protein Tco_0768952 [Tanacetum coccineum]|uniref:Reverse transcriptase domain-containing protein n=1 Tax=Tanacetum coccineum TaxID=301880 RepID=A0ABQ4Z9A1_9ASTR
MPTTRQGLSFAAIKQLITQRVAEAISAYEANQNNRNETQTKASGSAGGVEHTTRGCSYKAFLNCQPRNFDGAEGAVGLTRWFEKIESVFHICNLGIDVAYTMTWKELMKMMTEVYYPRNEIQKLENELWNLTVKGNDGIPNVYKSWPFYARKLFLMRKRRSRGTFGVSHNIQGNVTSAGTMRLQDTIRMVTAL